MTHMTWFGKQVFDSIEYVGEGVVSFLGLDDSRYQDVLDNMTEEEMNTARQVHEEREAENRLLQLTQQSQQETEDLEQAPSSTSPVEVELVAVEEISEETEVVQVSDIKVEENVSSTNTSTSPESTVLPVESVV